MLLFSSLLFTVYHVIIVYTLFICTSTFPFSYTLIGSLSDDPEFARPDWMFHLIDQVFLRSTLRKDSEFLFDYGILASPLFILFPDSLHIIISCHSSSLFIYYHVWMLICDTAMIMIYYTLDL